MGMCFEKEITTRIRSHRVQEERGAALNKKGAVDLIIEEALLWPHVKNQTPASKKGVLVTPGAQRGLLTWRQ